MGFCDFFPVPHNHNEFLNAMSEREGFAAAYAALEDEYRLVRELLAARTRAGLTQEEVAESMGTSKSAVSRLEAGSKHSPSLRTLKKYAEAVGCDIEIRLVEKTARCASPATQHPIA